MDNNEILIQKSWLENLIKYGERLDWKKSSGDTFETELQVLLSYVSSAKSILKYKDN